MLLEGSLPFTHTHPITIGHEATGSIIRLGSSATGFSVGDEIGFINAYRACFDCYGCSQHYTFCSAGSMELQGFVSNGYLQEYCKIDHRTAFTLPKGMDASLAARLNCAGITGMLESTIASRAV